MIEVHAEREAAERFGKVVDFAVERVLEGKRNERARERVHRAVEIIAEVERGEGGGEVVCGFFERVA